MSLAHQFTTILTTKEKRRNRFVSLLERQIIEACEDRRAHRDCERLIK